MAHTESQSHEVGTAVPYDIAQTIVSAVTAAELESNRARWQINLIVRDE
jgi:hypothetical protein